MSRLSKIALAVVLLLLGAGAAAWFTLDPDSLKPRLIAAVEGATGRTAAVQGPLRLRLFPSPAVTANGVTLGNRPGGSARPMAIVQTIEAHIAWLPLLSRVLDIDSITLVQPDILLETDADGVGNWQFTRPPAPPSTAAPTAAAPSVRLRTEVGRIIIQDGHLLYRDARDSHDVALDIPTLTLDAANPAGVHVAGTLAAHDTPIQLTATTGPLDRLATPDGAPWPLDLTLAAVGGQGTLKGTIADPLHGHGMDATLTASLPALDRLNAIFPRANLPALHDVALTTHIADNGTRLPAISDASLRAGASDLGFLRPGLALTSLTVTLPNQAAPLALQASLALNQIPLTIAGQIGPAAALAARQPVQVSLAAQLGAASLKLDGGVADPSHPGALDMQVALNAPDVAALEPALPGLPLPALRDLALSVHVLTTTRDQIALQSIALHLPQGDLAGDLTIGTAGRPKLTGTLTSQHLDLDAIAAVKLAAPPPPMAGPPPAAPPPPRPPLPTARAATLIPDQPLPFIALRLADADLTLSARQITAHRTNFDNLATHLLLADGHMALDPFAVHVGGGTLAGTLQADATLSPPSVALTLQVNDTPAEPFLALAGDPGGQSGTMDAHAQLHGTGASLHALAGTLDGKVGLTLVNGQIEAGHAASLLAPLLKSAGAPPGLEDQAARAHSDLRCFAAAATISHGVADLGTLMLDSAALEVSGSGTIALGPETLDLRLRPLLRLAGTGIAVPVRLSGPWRTPKTTWDGPDAHGKATFSAVIGALTKTGPAEDCGPALAAARDGQPGAAAAPAPKAKAPNLGDLLKGLTK